jgi:hypothetical protein
MKTLNQKNAQFNRNSARRVPVLRQRRRKIDIQRNRDGVRTGFAHWHKSCDVVSLLAILGAVQ